MRSSADLPRRPRHERLDGDRTLTLVRELPGPIERVWAFLTDPALLSRWFSDGVLEGRVGGNVEFEMGADGEVTVFEPPHVLEYTWNERENPEREIFDTVVRWELAPVNDRVRLTLTHKRLNAIEAINHSAGWHAFVDRLIAVANGREPVDVYTRFEELLPEYERHFNVMSNNV